MQHATQQLGVPFARPTNVSDVQYVYDIEARSGLAIPSIHLADIDDVGVFNDNAQLGDAGICPVSTGACIASVAGGVIEGWDMYGQYVRETVAAAGTSKIAFAGVTSGPTDMLWTNKFGLPYKYLAADAAQDAQVTITPPAADGDARGTFVYAGTKKVIELRYVADRDAPFGPSYAERFKSGDRVPAVTMAGTINAAGAVSITKTLIADGSRNQFYTMPDGAQITTPNAAGTVTHQLTPLWLSKYARTITDIDKLIRGGTENGTPILVNLTGAIVAPITAPAPAPAPVPLPGPVFPTLPASFTTHAQADAWLDEFTLALGVGEPLDWASQTLAQKHASAQALIDAIDEPT